MLLLIVWGSYASLIARGYFVADDLWQVNFAYKVFAGETQLIWANFVSNYLQIPGFDFYRPLLMFTVLSDYALWKTNAAGYYLTNTLFYSVCVLAFYAIALQLTESWGALRSRLAAISAAALFAANPLHCEDVSWIAGRPDVVSGAFYLGSFLLFLLHRKDGKKLTITLSLITFWLALMAKEASVALPVVLFTLCFLWPQSSEKAVEGTDASESEKSKVAGPNVEEEPKAADSKQSAKGKKKKRKGYKGDKGNASKESGGTGEAIASAVVGTKAVPDAPSVIARFRAALGATWIFWVLDVTYLCIRTNALGTFVGGYTGALGGALDQWVFLRWFELPTYYHILLPFTKAAFADGDAFTLYAWGAYLALGACCVMRLLSNKLSWKWAVFLLIWAVSGIIPLFKLWGVGANLEGSRLVFFFTMPLSLVCPILLLQPSFGEGRLKLTEEIQDRLVPVGCLGLGAMVLLYVAATYVTNSFWIGAGEESRAIQAQCFSMARNLKDKERAVILGIPKLNGGAHVIFNGTTLEELLSPPFIEKSVFQKFHSFEPFSVGPAETVNATRLKDLLRIPTTKGPFVWNRDTRNFDLCKVEQPVSMALSPIAVSDQKLDFKDVLKWLPKSGQFAPAQALQKDHDDGERTRAKKSDPPLKVEASSPQVTNTGPILKPFGRLSAKVNASDLVLQSVGPDDGFVIEGLNADPLTADFLEFELKCAPFDMVVPLFINWHGTGAVNQDENQVMFGFCPSKDKPAHKMRIRLSHYWRWFTSGKIEAIVVRLFSSNQITVSNVRLVHESELVPRMDLLEAQPAPNGEYFVDRRDLMFKFDKRDVKDAAKTEIEITKDNYFFDNFLFGGNATEIGRRLATPNLQGVGQLDANFFPKKAYYEVRIRCIGSDDRFVGEYSDPVTIFMKEAKTK